MAMNFKNPLTMRKSTCIFFSHLKTFINWFCHGGNGMVVYYEEQPEKYVRYFLLMLEFLSAFHFT